MALYAKRCDAAPASFMEKASARESKLESSAAARLNQFCGLPAISGLTDVDNGPPTQTSPHSDAGSRPPLSGRSQTVCMSRAIGIASPSRPAP